MGKLKPWPRGRVLLEITAHHPEEVLNFCAAHQIPVSGPKRQENGTLRLCTTMAGASFLREQGPGWMNAEILTERGPGKLRKQLSRRRVLVIAAALCVALAWVSSLFIWEIQVQGNETVPTARILSALESCGVQVGGFRFAARRGNVKNQVLLQVTELSWLTVNTRGCRLEVLVREERETPEMDDGGPRELAAARDGIVQRTTVQEGFACVEPGMAVEAGDVLVQSYAGSLNRGTRAIHARGQIWARTVREITAAAPIQLRPTYETGRVTQRYAILFGRNRLNCYFDSGNPYTECVKINMAYPAVLPGGVLLPVSLVRETFQEVTYGAPMSPEETERQLRESLSQALADALSPEAEILYTEYETEEQGGAIFVTLRAECLEDIALPRPASETEEIPE